MQATLEKTGRLLGIDFGECRVGLAMTDALQLTAQPFKTIRAASQEASLAQIVAVCAKYQIKGILVGLPLKMSGEEGTMSAKVRSFSERLQRLVNLPIVLWDERLSSLQAERILQDHSVSPSKNKHLVDKLAATLILRNYLDCRR